MGIAFVALVVVGLVAILIFLSSGAAPPPRPAPRPTAPPPSPTPGPPPSPKQFHYGFTFVTLPGLVLPNPAAAHAIETDEAVRQRFLDPDGAVGGVWRNLAKQLGLEKPYAELSVSIEEQPWGKCVLVTMPEPPETPLAHFIAIVPRGPDRVLYLTLEKSLNGTMIGGVSRNTRHDNYGPGPAPDKQKFLEALAPIVTGAPRG